ncbi:hypothetical protein R6Q59_036174 [Mikania micrantha]
MLGTDAGEVCFMEMVKAPAIQLFSFAEADTLLDLMPDIDTLFESKALESIRDQVTEIVTRLVEAARGMLLEFKNVVLHEPSKVPDPGGTIHPLTRSKHYKDGILSCVFIMNNIHYIVQNITGSPELGEMIGDEKAAIRYQWATWTGVYCLRDEGLYMGGSFLARVSKSALRERFKLFNAMFKEAHKMQALWLIPDLQHIEYMMCSLHLSHNGFWDQLHEITFAI